MAAAREHLSADHSLGPEGRHVIWKLPTYTRIHSMLTNPIYAGAYSWGRSTHRVRIEEGRKRISRGHRRARAEWPVFIADHHEGYISWEQYERNQRVMVDNANSKRLTARGSIRRAQRCSMAFSAAATVVAN